MYRQMFLTVLFDFHPLSYLILFLARDEKPPKVIMTSKSFDSVTLSFDHFAPKGYKHGYVAMVSLIRANAIITRGIFVL